MGAPLADPERLGSWLGLGDLNDVDFERAAEVVGTISDLVRGEARQPDWTLNDVPVNVSAIVLMVSVECWVNPDNKSSVTVDDVTRRWESGDLFSPAQLATLRSFRPGRASGLSTVQFGRGMTAPSIALPDGLPPVAHPAGDAVRANVVGGNPAVLYDGRGY